MIKLRLNQKSRVMPAERLQKLISGNCMRQVASIEAKQFILLLGLALLTNHRVLAQKSRATIFFRNGTIVIGKIKNAKLGVVTFDPDDANDITVQLRRLKSMAATSTVFRIERP